MPRRVTLKLRHVLASEAAFQKCFEKFRKLYKKTPVPESPCEIFKNTFSYRTPPVAASITIGDGKKIEVETFF